MHHSRWRGQFDCRGYRWPLFNPSRKPQLVFPRLNTIGLAEASYLSYRRQFDAYFRFNNDDLLLICKSTVAVILP